MKVRLDNILREYVKERDSHTCQTCGCHKDSTMLGTLDWSHKISRRNLFLRWDERNSIAQCRACHDKWGCGISVPMNEAIDKIWGNGTANWLEDYAIKNTTIKGTLLDSVDYRLKIESFYKKKLKALKEGFIEGGDITSYIWDEDVKLGELE
jgi:hypothetical protein